MGSNPLFLDLILDQLMQKTKDFTPLEPLLKKLHMGKFFQDGNHNRFVTCSCPCFNMDADACHDAH